jgi:long-chain acyl-CoA synthetase
VLRDGATLDEAAVRAFARDQLTAYKVPKRVVQADDLPRSLIGKVLRRQVRNSLLTG